MKKFLAGCAVAALATSAVYAQETTSSIQGTVTSGGKAVSGATVRVVHVPTGTVSTAQSRPDGNFTAAGLRVGGPFSVTVSAPGYTDFQATDLETVVGQPFSLPVELLATGPEIVVTASSVRGARILSEGPATVLTSTQISKVASINRDIRDLMRRDPFANIDKSSATAAVSFAGQNPRFNRFTIDGVPITDSFGLNPDALPSRRGPVPLDAIGQFETKVAPYDIREGFFQGGVVNAILKSGTNQFHGTAFYSYTDDGLVGKKTKSYLTSGGVTDTVAVPPFKNRDYGATISGPIIKDTIFFMVSAERVRAATPYPYGTTEDNAGVPVTNLSNAQLSQIQQISQSRYSYPAGGIVRNNGDKDDRIVGRIDANISPTQRASLTGIYTKDSLISLTNTGTSTLSLESNSYIKPNRVIAGIGQLNSDWGGGLSTEVRGLYKQYDSGQFPQGTRSSAATVCTAATSDRPTIGSTATDTFNQSTVCPNNVAQVQLGTGGPSQANILKVRTYGGSVLARLATGNHNFRALVEYQFTKDFNLFVNGALGTYYFDSIADFQAGNAQSFTYTNSPSGDVNQAAAKFQYSSYTFGIQDSWKINPELNVSYGVRFDMFGGNKTLPAFNPIFFNRYGFSNQSYLNGRSLLQPRIGFDYTPIPRLTIRGGGGIFGGGSPDVYVGNSFSNTGVLQTSLTARLSDQLNTQLNGVRDPSVAALLNNVNLTTVPAQAGTLLARQGGSNLTSNPNNTTTLNALDPKFKIPSQWRATLSGRYKANLGPLGDGWNFGVDGFYSKVRNQVAVIDIRSVAIASVTPDGRQRYASVITAAPTDGNADYLLTNSSKGRSYIAVASINKAWRFGLSAGASFTYQNVKDNQAFLSSIASSNYGNGAYYDPNSLTGSYGHSIDEVPYAFKYNVSYEHAFFRDYKSRIDLFGETRQGYNYSYGFQDTSSGRSTAFGTVGTRSRYLFYVPTGPNDPLVVYDTPASQAAIDAIISGSGLSKYRGQVAPRNAFHSKWFTRLDLHVEQEIPTFVGHSRITLWADVENFTNLLNHKWGQQLRANFPYIKTVANVTCVASGTNPCAQYRYSAPTSDTVRADSLVNGSLGASLYAVRFGARLSF